MKLSIEILNDYPLATEAIRDWFMKRMEQSLQEDNVAEDFKNEILRRGIPDHTLAIMLDQSPRNFFDVLDENRIFVEIKLSPYAEGGFFYVINNVEDNQIYETRVPCERAAVVRALKTLDGK
jgi:hypothetical protein